MMQRIVSYTLDDLAADPKAVEAGLNTACRSRRQKYRVNGVCQLADTVHFVLLPVESVARGAGYVIAPADETGPDGFTAELSQRWASGYDAIGTMEVGETLLVLYTRAGQRD